LQGPPAAADEEELAGETMEQRMLARTRALNEALRARPHELQLWLDFAAWQDELARCGTLAESSPCCMPTVSSCAQPMHLAAYLKGLR
jgi:hypothetical protein